MPVRLQFKRQKGFRLPPNALRVTRPSRWGNPFKVGQPNLVDGQPITGEDALRFFEKLVEIRLARQPEYLEPLRGKDLACFCSLNSECHADILLKYANRD